jgi:hypothetical protein
MTYDLVRGRLLVFGGETTSGPLNDTWQRQDAVYVTAPVPALPAARQDAVMVYDEARGQSIMFGGRADGGILVNETWAWDGTRWEHRTPAAPAVSPGARNDHAMTYDSRRERVVLFGGNAPSYANDTWEWDGTSWLQRQVTTATPGTNQPPTLVRSAVAYDTARGRVVLFGGLNLNTGRSNATWEWDGTTWTNVTPVTGSPPARDAHAMAYDADRGRVVMFGGSVGNSSYNPETWEWDGTTWTDRTTLVSPPQRRKHTLTYDPSRRRVVLVGGEAGPALEDTWEWDGTAWTELTVNPPAPRWGAAVAYDRARRRLFAFGGTTNGSTGLSDVWDLHWESNLPEEVCTLGGDADRDQLIGCDDGDCWGYCDPTCPPGTSCVSTRARCGDATCTTPLESCRSCPVDCGACPANVCGDFLCDPPEAAATCAADCS